MFPWMRSTGVKTLTQAQGTSSAASALAAAQTTAPVVPRPCTPPGSFIASQAEVFLCTRPVVDSLTDSVRRTSVCQGASASPRAHRRGDRGREGGSHRCCDPARGQQHIRGGWRCHTACIPDAAVSGDTAGGSPRTQSLLGLVGEHVGCLFVVC